MKQRLIFLLFFLAIVYSSNAQIKLGIKAGIGVSNKLRIEKPFRFSSNEHFTPLISYKTGIFTSIPISDKLSVSTDFLFINSRNTQHLGSLEPVKMSYYHLSIPLLLNIQLNKRTSYNIGIANLFHLNSNSVITNNYNIGLITGIDIIISKKLRLGVDIYCDIMPFEKLSNYPGVILEDEFDTLYYLYSSMINLCYVIK